MKGASTVAPNMRTCRNRAQSLVAYQPLPPLPSAQPPRCARAESAGEVSARARTHPPVLLLGAAPEASAPLSGPRLGRKRFRLVNICNFPRRCCESDSEADARIKWIVERPLSHNSIHKCRHAACYSGILVPPPPPWMIAKLLQQDDLQPSCHNCRNLLNKTCIDKCELEEGRNSLQNR